MARPWKHVPVPVRDMLISDWEDKENGIQTYSKLAAKYKLKLTTVYQIVQRYKSTGIVGDKPGRGRKPVFTPRESREVAREAKANPFVSSRKLKEMAKSAFGKDVSTKTVRNYLRKEGLRARVARRKPLISKVNRKKRLDFARKHCNQPLDYWNKVLWTDETKINLFGSDCGRNVWRRPREALKVRNVIPTVKHGGGNIMIWGSMASSGVGTLEFIDGRMDADMYIDILERNVKPSAQKLGFGRRWIFQQDNDPKHTSKKAQAYFKKSRLQVLEWPPQSPDLNPIEHLWGILKKSVYETRSSSISGLKVKVEEAWEKITMEETKRLVDSMPRRLQAVIEANGGPTAY